MSEPIFAVDIGGSKLICGILNTNGEVLSSHRTEYEPGVTPDTIFQTIRADFAEMGSYAPVCCAAAVPGLCDAETGTWLYSPFSGFSNIPVARLLTEMTGLPTFADNDVNISTLAERRYGVCGDCNDFVWVTVSNGIGGGLFLNGKLYRGWSGNAGEIGHLIVEEKGGRRCGCGREGCLEAMASGASMAARYREWTGRSCSAREIAVLVDQGDETALRVWQEAGAYIGKAAAHAVNLLGLDTVVLGGGAAQRFDLLELSATRALNDYVFSHAHPQVRLLQSALGGFAALKGCAALAVERYFEK